MTAFVFALLALIWLAAGLVIAGQGKEARRVPLDEAERDKAPGHVVSLAFGKTKVVWNGPSDARVVVCVHGLTTPSPVWGPLADQLVPAGYRLLTFDLYGRRFSDAPDRRHDLLLYVDQLREVLDAQGLTGPVPLMGYSMGGAIVTAFADAHPQRCSSLALLAPGGLKDGLGGFYARCAKLPVLGDALWSLQAPRLLLDGAEASAKALPDLPAVMAREVGRRGVLPAQLSALRHTLTVRLDAHHRRIAERQCPVLAIWGAQDVVIPIACKPRLAMANSKARQVVLPDAGHELAYSHADEVAAQLQSWLREVG